MKKILNEELEKIKISPEGEQYLENIAEKVISKLDQRLGKKNIDASVFIGGSLAKNTLIRKKKYDIDLFLRFNKKYSEQEMKKIFKRLFVWFRIRGERVKVRRLHGSRDYYRVFFKRSGISVEVIPVVKISKPEQARNLTDLSYFHVKYIGDKIEKKKGLDDEIRLAKSFAHACHCYGAESYIHGFSGYALEILVSHYKSFKKFLQEIVKADGQIVIDSGKHYKTKKNILESLNPTKTKSPIILIDPTFKERNAARALSKETLSRFRAVAKQFLKEPGSEFFEPKKVDILGMKEKAKEVEGIFAVFEFKTKKQPGDIAGTKMLKFSRFLTKELKNVYEIEERKFDYPGLKRARFYVVLKRKKEIIFNGPELHRKESVKKFKEKHKIWYEEEGRVKSAKATDLSIKEFLKMFKRGNKRTIKQMSVRKVKLV
ncbi:hypothetical protein CMI46_01580 [Candidatus Pacearchaeota archaeon]|nr:hypothetical protein [Candidatus Pacearchaeota archaeon]|tara:strand:- start:306 stop:1595 length:1290 start_codon:yes stop_codon:yes gene_type:complete